MVLVEINKKLEGITKKCNRVLQKSVIGYYKKVYDKDSSIIDSSIIDIYAILFFSKDYKKT